MTTVNHHDNESLARPSRLRNLLLLWEDLHPLARGNFLLSLVSLLVAALIWFGLRVLFAELSPPDYFALSFIKQVWHLGSFALAAILAYGALRIGRLALQKRASYLSVLLAVAAVVMVGFPPFIMPSFFEVAVSQEMNHSYGQVFDTAESLCQFWKQEHADQSPHIFDPNDADIGIFDADTVDVFREQSTVFFNFGDEDYAYGLACVIDGGEPADQGRRSRKYEYAYLRGDFYEFYSETD
ncbi:MAG: hypothetical protein GYB66_15210 [Chloroflexi bacterium]|nr:hypothetical protein [Chloroflexota bacterium]